MINTILLVVIIGWVFKKLSANYESGVVIAAFFLVVLPDSIGIELGTVLPNFSASRLIIVLVTIFWWKQHKQNNSAVSSAPFFRIQYLGAVFLIVTSLIAEYPLPGIKRFLFYVCELFGLFCIIQSSIRTRAFSERLISAIGYGLLLVACLAWAERFFGFRILNDVSANSTNYGVTRFAWADLNIENQIRATFKHRILLGVACAIGSGMFLIDSVFQNSTTRIVKALLFCTICGSALYFANSRGPWLAFAVFCLASSAVMFSKFLKRLIVLGLIVTTILALRPGVMSTIVGLGSATMDQDTVKGASFQWRFLVMQYSLREIAHSTLPRFLFGYGCGCTSLKDFGRIELPNGLSLPLESWDCELAIVLYERGILGFSCVAILYGMAIYQFGRFLIRYKQSGDRVVAFAFGCHVILGFMMLNVAMFAQQLSYLEVMALAVGSKTLQTNGFKDTPNLATLPGV